jgi:DNA polymerase-1
MIHFVTTQTDLFSNSNICIQNTTQPLIEWLSSLDRENNMLEFDIETKGFDFNDDLVTVQLGFGGNQYVIDCSTINIKLIKEYLETFTLIGHNLKFDLKFMYKVGIYPYRIIDTYIAECILNRGMMLPKGYRSLESCCQRYLNVSLDKSARSLHFKEGLSFRFIKYGAEDVTYLTKLYSKQLHKLEEENLEVSFLLECQFVLSLSYTMFCGIKLDKEKWLKRLEKYKTAMNENVKDLNKFAIANSKKHIDRQLDLFNTETKVKINWASEKQVKEVFKNIGLVPVDKSGKVTIEEGTLIKYKDEFPVISLFIEYQKNKKQITTYGEEFLNNINIYTGRIHSEFHQIQDTGRMSSENPNLQNIPSDPETRACFVSEEDWNFVSADYSGQEQVILANFCKDKYLIDFYKQGHSDMHSYVASKMYPEISHLSLKEIKEQHKDKRQIAKSAGFAINYGGTGITIAENTGISKEQGDIVYEAYINAFPGLKEYFKKVKRKALELGKIVVNSYTNATTYINNYEEYKRLNSIVSELGFWDSYKSDDEFKELNKGTVRSWAIAKSSIERMALNYPIQGTAADMTKLAVVYFFKEIKLKGLLGHVKFVNIVHDEINIEVRESHTEEVCLLLKECMERAGNRFCTIIPIKAEIEVAKFWKK